MADPVTPAVAPVVPAVAPVVPVVVPPVAPVAPVVPPVAPVVAVPPASALTAEPAAPGTGAPKDGAGKPAVAAPTDIVIKVPEGFNVDKGVIDGFAAFAKEHKIGGEAAQKYVDGFLAVQQTQQAEQFTKWAEEAKADPEIGGAKFDQTVAAGRKALQRFGTPALIKTLNASGLGNHKDVLRFFAQVGTKISEDKLPGGSDGAGGGPTVDPMRAMYPTMFPK